MSKVCDVTGKKQWWAIMFPMLRTCETTFSNLHKHKFWVESENKFVTLTVSTKGMRIIDKNGMMLFLKT